MKRLFTLCLLVCISSISNAQLLVENFNYSGLLNANGWTVHSGSGTEAINTTTGLTYTGYANSNIGNAANVVGSGEDVNRRFTDQNVNGATVYMSTLVNFTETASSISGGYFLHLGNRADPGTTFTNFCARVWARIDATGNVNIGITNSSTAAYSTTNYAKNTTYLLIIKYTINTAGADNVKMWIRSSGVPATEVAAGTPDIDITAETGLDLVNAIGIRQAANIPDVVVDGIRIANDWYNAPLPISLESFGASLINGKPSLNWSTINEVNINGFGVEKSKDGINFNQLDFVAAKNTSKNSYNYIDVITATGTTYYRLKITGKDGTYKYSQILTVTAKQSIKLDVFPNPVSNTVVLSHPKAVHNTVARVITVDGKTLVTYTVPTGATQSSIDVSKLKRGHYIVVFDNDGTRSSLQFIKE